MSGRLLASSSLAASISGTASRFPDGEASRSNWSTHRFDRTRDIACPVIGFFGRDDTNPSPADVDRIDAELTRHGKPHEFHRYDGAGHAFLNFANAERYRPDQAKDAWAKMLDFLDRHVKDRTAR